MSVKGEAVSVKGVDQPIPIEKSVKAEKVSVKAENLTVKAGNVSVKES